MATFGWTTWLDLHLKSELFCTLFLSSCDKVLVEKNLDKKYKRSNEEQRLTNWLAVIAPSVRQEDVIEVGKQLRK